MFRTFAHLPQSQLYDENTVAVIPLGAMEAHGPHLPLGTDTLIVEGILDHAATLDRSDVTILRLPALWLGASGEHADRTGTLALEPEALIAQIVAIGDGLACAGVRRVLLFNGHGGNIAAAAIAALKLRRRFEMLAASVHWLDYGLPAGFQAPSPVKDDIHGGWIETSVLLHLAPQMVGKIPPAQTAAVPAAGLFPAGPVNWGWMTSDIAPGGYVGRPDLATADIGRDLVAYAADCVQKTLQELAAAMWQPTGDSSDG